MLLGLWCIAFVCLTLMMMADGFCVVKSQFCNFIWEFNIRFLSCLIEKHSTNQFNFHICQIPPPDSINLSCSTATQTNLLKRNTYIYQDFWLRLRGKLCMFCTFSSVYFCLHFLDCTWWMCRTFVGTYFSENDSLSYEMKENLKYILLSLSCHLCSRANIS